MTNAVFNSMRFGYTLIEASVVLVILGITAILLVPHLGNQADTELQGAARQLVADISWAQCDAVASQGYRRLHFYADGRGWCLLDITDRTFADSFDAATAVFAEDPWRTRRGGGDFIVDFPNDDRYVFVTVSDITTGVKGGRDLTFDRLGGTVSAPGLGAGAATVTLSDGTDSWQVDIAPVTGRVAVSRAE